MPKKKDKAMSLALQAKTTDSRTATSTRKFLVGNLRVSSADNPREREADRVADEVTRGTMLKPGWSFSRVSVGTPSPRKCACVGSGHCEECKERAVQRHKRGVSRPPEADLANTAPDVAGPVLASTGRAMDQPLRTEMARLFGFDFSRVRIHSGTAAEQSAEQLNARAYTVGNDIVFGAGQFQPNSLSGRHLIAHELTHVLQQQPGEPLVHRSVSYPKPAVTRTDDPILRFLVGTPGGLGACAPPGQVDRSLACTTITVNGSNNLDDKHLLSALAPKSIEKNHPAAPSQNSGSGSGSGSGGSAGSGVGQGQGSGGGSGAAAAGGSAQTQCRFKDFEIKISANKRLPMPPNKDGKWETSLEAGKIGIINDPECRQKNSQDLVSIVMRGDPNSNDFYEWVTANEDEHVSDFVSASEQFLVTYQKALFALQSAGKDDQTCEGDLKAQLKTLAVADVIRKFQEKLAADIQKRDVPGGHNSRPKEVRQRDHCNYLSILLEKSPPPTRSHP